MIERSLEFDLAYRFITETNQNLFLTGKAGTGKTTFLKYLKSHSHKNMTVAAPTGVAAINAGGVTLHSLFQLPFAPFLPQPEGQLSLKDHPLLSQVRFSGDKLKLFRNLELLVIDEVSMVPSHTVDAIDLLLRGVRRNYRQPFGGVQVLFIGDLHQLPPVVKNYEWEMLRPHYPSVFFFDSKVLREQVPVMVELRKIYRQRESSFTDILNEIRNDSLSPENFSLLNTRFKPGFMPADEEGFITLTTHNSQADQINRLKLQECQGEVFQFRAKVEGDFPQGMFPAEESLELKKGAQVMFLKNDVEDRLYFNGKIGRISFLSSDKIKVKCEGEQNEIELKKYTWKNIRYTLDEQSGEIGEEELGGFEQFPLRLAWAITIHKSQGLTFEKLIVDAENAFANGQVYVALSRCTSLEGLVLTSGLNRKFLGSSSNLKEWEQKNHQEEILEQKLELAREAYIQEVLNRIFDLKKDFREFEKFVAYIEEDKQAFSDAAIPWLKEIRTQVDNLKGVAEKFIRRMEELRIGQTSFEQNEPLRSRLQDAGRYFVPRMETLKATFYSHSITSEKRKHALQADEFLKGILLMLQEKIEEMRICAEGFDLESYTRRSKTLQLAEKFRSSFRDPEANAVHMEGDASQHSELFARLAKFRSRVAGKSGKRASQILKNDTLVQICEILPDDMESLAKVKGLGKVKMQKLGKAILDIVHDYCRENHVQREDRREVVELPQREEGGISISKGQSLALFLAGQSIEEIAKERNYAISTIEGHLADAIKSGLLDIERLMPMEEVQALAVFFPPPGERLGLSEIRANAGGEISYGKLKWVQAWLLYSQHSLAKT